jgi:hypothetical protein
MGTWKAVKGLIGREEKLEGKLSHRINPFNGNRNPVNGTREKKENHIGDNRENKKELQIMKMKVNFPKEKEHTDRHEIGRKIDVNPIRAESHQIVIGCAGNMPELEILEVVIEKIKNGINGQSTH